jgi:hypothetical protein
MFMRRLKLITKERRSSPSSGRQRPRDRCWDGRSALQQQSRALSSAEFSGQVPSPDRRGKGREQATNLLGASDFRRLVRVVGADVESELEVASFVHA